MSATGSMTGKVLNNRYEIGERIGVGGMAEVYSAQDNVLGRIVAVKVMLSQFAEDDDFARRFRQEAAAAANLQSPYIVNVYDWGHDAGTYFIVMEYVRGSDLKSAVKQRGAINQRKVAEIGAQVCQALQVAHSQDIVHRDIKPQNIMIQPDGNVKVMDFGIARAKNSVSEKTGNVLGTAHYISPEQAQGKDLTSASDIYSLGVVLYEAATGKLPFDGPDAVSVALMQVKDEPMLPSSINPEVKSGLESIIMRAMQKDPSARYATAQEMRSDLNDFLAGRLSSSFTSQQTSVMSPTAAAAGAAVGAGAAAALDHTSVMPTVGNENNNGTSRDAKNYKSSDTAKKGKMSPKKKAAIGIAVAIAAIAIIVGCVFAFGGGDRVEVPNVVGKTTEEASRAIENAGFKVGKMDSAYDTNTEAGKVISQNPGAGDKAAKGATINLVVSQGTEKVSVPDVTGKSQSEATSALTKLGFAIGTVTQESSDKVSEGNVISTDPAAGSEAAKGSTINIVVSKGSDKVTVPNFVGLSLSEAKAKAEAAGLYLSQTGSDYSDQYDQDTIISQNPSSGSQVASGSSVGYVVSLGAGNVKVPDVEGYTQSGAKSSLESSGLKVSIVEEYSDSVEKGLVISTNPSSGTSVESGTTITVTVSKGKSSSSTSGASKTS